MILHSFRQKPAGDVGDEAVGRAIMQRFWQSDRQKQFLNMIKIQILYGQRCVLMLCMIAFIEILCNQSEQCMRTHCWPCWARLSDRLTVSLKYNATALVWTKNINFGCFWQNRNPILYPHCYSRIQAGQINVLLIYGHDQMKQRRRNGSMSLSVILSVMEINAVVNRIHYSW